MNIRNKQGNTQQIAVTMDANQAAAIQVWLSKHKLTGCPALHSMYKVLRTAQ